MPLANLFMLLNYYSGQICLALSDTYLQKLSLQETKLLIEQTSLRVFDLIKHNNEYYTTIKGKKAYLFCVNLHKNVRQNISHLPRYLFSCDLTSQKSAQMVALANSVGQLT